MTSEEKLYLYSIKTFAINRLANSANVYVTSHCSRQFYKNVLKLLPNNTIANGRVTYLGSKKYGLIIDQQESEIDIIDITKFKKNLSIDGLIAIGLKNYEFLQHKKNIKKHKLDRKNDKKIAEHMLYPVFREPMGKFYKLNKIDPKNPINSLLQKTGVIFPYSRLYSPYKVLIYQLRNSNINETYQPFTSFKKRLQRLGQRMNIYVSITKRPKSKIAHVVHGLLSLCVKILRFSRRLYRFAKRILFGILCSSRLNMRFRSDILPHITSRQPSPGKKILIIAMTYLGIGGVERVMMNIIKGIDRKKFEIHIITTVLSDNVWHEEFQKISDHIVHVPEIIDESWPRKFRQQYAEEYITRSNADILLITNSEVAYRATKIIRKRIPGIHIYDLLHTHGTPKDNDAYLKISIPFDKYINKRIVINNYLKQYYVKKYPIDKDKIEIIYNGVSTNMPSNTTRRQKDALLSSIPKNKKIISYIGRLETDKSPFRLVDIAIELKKQRLPICIVVIGDGPLKDRMINKSVEKKVINDYIYFYGASKKPLSLMMQSDFTILVSDNEGIPMSVLESMSTETPVISSAVGGVPEIITDGTDGFLVNISNKKAEPAKIHAFVKAITMASKLTTEETRKIGKSAKQKIIGKFSSMAEKYEQLFETGLVPKDKNQF